MRGAWTPESWTLNLMIELDGAPIGSQSILAERFATFRTVRTGSWLGRAFQRRGFGREMREAVLGFGFDGLRALVAETEAFTDNAASNAVSRSIGYAENGWPLDTESNFHIKRHIALEIQLHGGPDDAGGQQSQRKQQRVEPVPLVGTRSRNGARNSRTVFGTERAGRRREILGGHDKPSVQRPTAASATPCRA
jgi:hypothetical protein